MTLAVHLIESVASFIGDEMEASSLGHCLRVDHLSIEDARALCENVRQIKQVPDVEAYVLDSQATDGLFILPEKAIEIRNRKRARLCLFVPAGFIDAATSSLVNSFAAFDLQDCMQKIAQTFIARLPAEMRPVIGAVKSQLRGATQTAPEHWADFLATVAENPTEEKVGEELWRIGLIPDVGGAGLEGRLAENRRCVLSLVHPARAHSSAQERVEGLGIRRGAVRDELLAYLQGKRLRDARSWMEELSREPLRARVSFEKWTFESAESDLDSIEIEPFLDKEGLVDPYTKLDQPSGPGTQPVAAVGGKRKVVVKWTATPTKPTNLTKWRVELIPSREEYAEEESAGVDLPFVRTAAKTRRASVPLDLDLDTLPVRAVQIRITGVDQFDAELRDGTGKVIEGLSEEFWLSADAGPELVSSRPFRDTVPTLPFARIKAVIELPINEVQEAPGQWTESELHYFAITLNGRRTSRIGLSPVLKAVEERCLGAAEEFGRYSVTLDATESINAEDLQLMESTGWPASEVGKTFLSRRRDFFRTLQKQEHRGLIETAAWDGELSKRARAYASGYRDLLSVAGGADLAQILTIDSVELKIQHTETLDRAILMFPTHPLRALWYAAYSDLLRHWESELLKLDGRPRKIALDLQLLERIAPLNYPAFVVSSDDEVFLMAQNLRFFWGVALPVTVKDPGRRIAEVAQAVGLREDEASLADLPPSRVARELQAYQEVHPYLETFRLSVINPGSGSFVAASLRGLYPSDGEEHEEDSGTRPPPKLEVIAHAHKPLPLQLPALTRLQSELYASQQRGRLRHLSPLFTLSLRSVDLADSLPGGDVNATLAIDELAPSIRPAERLAMDDSSSFYGLLVRLMPSFLAGEGGWTWRHQVSLPRESSRERHPATPTYTNDLIDSQEAYLQAVSKLMGGDESTFPAVDVEISPEDRLRLDRIHHVSDWVITLDRFFGVEFYDDPSDSNLSRVARKYLLDYAPEFLEGLGHRMLVTTSHREEVEEILARAMRDLGFGMIEESVGEVLEHLKTISGRLAVRILGDDARAREAVSLGVASAYLRAKGELADAILIPVDSHPELFGVSAREKRPGGARLRCDLIRVRFLRNRMVATFIEVKSRAATGESEELLNRIVDQIEATEEVFRDLFFRKDPLRLDRVLQRSRLASILRFYLGRAKRHGLVSSEEGYRNLEESIGRLESGVPDIRTERLGFVVNLSGFSKRPTKLRDTTIRFISSRDLAESGLWVEPSSHKPLPDETPERPQEEQFDLGVPSQTSKVPAQAQSKQADVVGSPAPSTPDEEGIRAPLGLTEADGTIVEWRPSIKGSPHLFILGIPGQGKSWTVMRLLTLLARQGLPCLVLDFHGQFGDPDSPYGRAAGPEVLDASQGLPFSPFEAQASPSAGSSYWRTNCFSVAEIFQYVCDLGDIQRDVVYEALRDCYVDLGFEEGAQDTLPTVDQVRRRLEELEDERGVRNVVPRTRSLLEFGLFRDGPTDSGGFETLLEKGLIVDVHALGLETLQLAAGAFMLRKIYKDMFQWGTSDKLRLVIVLDEAHRLAQDITLPKLMKEGRKFGVAVVVASQGLADYHPDVVGNAGTKVVFRTNFPMSKKVAGFLRASKGLELAAAIEQLDVGEAYVQTPEMGHAARVRMFPLDSGMDSPID